MKLPKALDNLSLLTAPAVTAQLFACTVLVGLTFTSVESFAALATPANQDADLTRTRESNDLELEWDDLEQRIDVGELEASRITLEQRVGELQTVGDRYDARLVKPLSLLGRIYHEQQDYPRAAETFALATQISRIANGLHSAEQLEIVHQEIASLKAMGNIVEANSRHEYAFSIASRHYGRFAQQLIPELLKIGTWYTSTGDVIGARGSFSDARVLLSADQTSAQSDQMIFALRGLANTYRSERFPPFYQRTSKEAEELFARNGLRDRQTNAQLTEHRLTVNAMFRGTQALVDVLRIEGNRLLAEQEKYLQAKSQETLAAPQEDANVVLADTQAVILTEAKRRRSNKNTLDLAALGPALEAPEVDKSRFLKAILDLADWHLLNEQDARAFAWYQQAYIIAQTDPNSDAVAMFSQPKLLYFPRPQDPKLPERLPPTALEKGHVALSYDIDHRGHVKRMKTVDSIPKGLMEFRVRTSVKVTRYRPRILDGLPQPTAAYSFKHSFDYLPRNRKAAPPNVINSDDLTDIDTTIDSVVPTAKSKS